MSNRSFLDLRVILLITGLPPSRCKRCDGKRVVKQKKKLSVIVEPGSLDAERIVLPQKGDQVVRIIFTSSPPCMSLNAD